MTAQRLPPADDCPNDHEQLLADMRLLPTTDLGKLAAPLLPAALNGDAGPATLEALKLIGVVLSERRTAA